MLQMLKNGLIRHKFLFCFVRTVVVFTYAKRGQKSIRHTCRQIEDSPLRFPRVLEIVDMFYGYCVNLLGLI
jgi:hypothetical protein